MSAQFSQEVELRVCHVCSRSHPSCLDNGGPLCKNSRARRCPTGSNFDDKQIQGVQLVSFCRVTPSLVLKSKSGTSLSVRAEVSALSVRKLQKPGYQNKPSWPWEPSPENRDLRLECQQRHVHRLNREVEAGKRKKGGLKEWVPHSKESMLVAGPEWEVQPGQAPCKDLELDPESTTSLVLEGFAIQYNGNQVPWQLMIRLLLRDDKVDASMWKELDVLLSEPMQVITGRAALERKARFPRFDDDVEKLHGVGNKTAEKLRRIEEFMTTKKVVQKHGNVKLPEAKLLCVTEVGQLVELVKWAQQNWPRALLSELLTLKDLNLGSVIMEKDDCKRLYVSRHHVQYGLLYDCQDGAVTDTSNPVALLHFASSGTTYRVDESLATREQAQTMVQLALEAQESWQMSGHPNWAVLQATDEGSLVPTNGAMFAAALQGSPGTEGSSVGTQPQPQQQLRGLPLPRTALRSLTTTSRDLDMDGSHGPTSHHAGLGCPSGSIEREESSQVKRRRQQQEPVPKVAVAPPAAFASHPQLHQYPHQFTQQSHGAAPLGLSMDHQLYHPVPHRLPQQALFPSVQHADSLNPPTPQPQGLSEWKIGDSLHPSLNQHSALEYSGGVHYPPIPLPVCSTAAAFSSPYALQNHMYNHTQVTASAAAVCSAPRQPSFGPSATEPGFANGHKQAGIEERHALGAAAHIDPEGYGHSIQSDVQPGPGRMASSGHNLYAVTPEPHMEQAQMETDSLLKATDSLLKETDLLFTGLVDDENFNYAAAENMLLGCAGSSLTMPAADDFALDFHDGDSGTRIYESTAAPGSDSLPQPSEGSFPQPSGQGSYEVDVQQAQSGSPSSVQPNTASPPRHARMINRQRGPLVSLCMMLLTFGLMLCLRQPDNRGARHVPRKLFLETDQLDYKQNPQMSCQMSVDTPLSVQLSHLDLGQNAIQGSLPASWSNPEELPLFTLDAVLESTDARQCSEGYHAKQCSEGYHGPMCSLCLMQSSNGIRYGRTDTFSCKSSRSSGATVCAYLGSVLLVLLWLMYTYHTTLQQNGDNTGGVPHLGRTPGLNRVLTLWLQHIMQLSTDDILAPGSILWAVTFAASTVISSIWLDTDTYQIMPSPVMMGSSLAPMLLHLWQLWMLVAFLPPSRGSVDGSLGSVWRILQQARLVYSI